MADDSKYPTRIAPYGLRMPPELKARVQKAADAAGRTLHGELIHTLEEAYPAPRHPADRLVVRMFQLLALLPDDRIDEFVEEMRENLDIGDANFSEEFEALKNLILSARTEHGGPLPEDYVMDFLSQSSLKDALPKDPRRQLRREISRETAPTDHSKPVRRSLKPQRKVDLGDDSSS